MINIASEFSKSIQFVDSPQKIDPKYIELAFIIRDNLQKPNNSYFEENFERIFSSADANTVVNSDEYKKIYEQVTNSIITSAIVRNIPNTVKSFNVFVVYALYLIKQLATNALGSEKINDSTIIIPKGIFPLPPVKNKLEEEHKNEQDRRKKIIDEAQKKVEEIAQNIEGNNNAIKEIIDVFEKSSPYERKKSRGLTLSQEVSEKVSMETKQILRNHGLSANGIDITKSISILRKSNNANVDKLRKNITTGTTMIKMGSVLLPVDYFSYDFVPSNNQTDPCSLIPGVCPPIPVVEDNKPTGEITTPMGYGQAHAYGVSDLMVVEQNLSHYELGEIAHIENVLKSEIRTRELRTTKTREESELTETEETSEKTEDLSTTERYELGVESQNVINENSSTQIGITVTASYGPSVDITGNFNYSTSTSTQDSKSASTNFSRDTTTRAINRLEKRKLHRRFVRTVEEVMERNKHIFKNDVKDADNISGIYRWVDKIYELQVVNYGKRFMLEFIVPEPAAFLRYAMSKLPSQVNTFVKPDPPGYCLDDGKTFQPLQVEDITRECYLDWITKYNVQDVSPPPSDLITISKANHIKGEEMKETEGHLLSVIDSFIDIPDGYIPQKAIINLRWEGGTDGDMHVQIQDKQVSASEMDIGGSGQVVLDPIPTSIIPYTIDTKEMYNCAIIVNIECILSLEKFTDWQLNIYNAIMNAYNDEKSRYDDEVRRTVIRTGFSEIKGKNPLYNRETEKLELKKGCISILTAQRYDVFDAVKKNVAPYGYPEIVNFNEARVDGEYIRRFEQAFEWTNMTYVFYPYFWGNKEDWVVLSKLDDADPLFARFLQAGAARVLVPVRPGFEKTIVDYLHIEVDWNAEGYVIPEGDETDDVNISIVEEIKSQTGNNSIDGKGTLNVTKNSANVVGTDTEFNKSQDENRRIIIKGKIYIIKKVQDKTNIILTSPYLDETDSEVIYSLGGILVGQPWQVKLPTSLVKLDSSISIK